MKKVEGETQTHVSKSPDKFIADDGKVFYSEKEALEHENELEAQKKFIEKYKLKIIDVDQYGIRTYESDCVAKSIFLETIDYDTIKDLIVYYPYLKPSVSNELKNIKPGINIIVEERYDSDSMSRWGGYSMYIYSPDDIIDEKNEELKKLQELKDSYLVK